MGRLGWSQYPLLPSGNVETGRVETPTAGSCFHFHPLWDADAVGTQAVPELAMSLERPLSQPDSPSCIKYMNNDEVHVSVYSDSLAPSDMKFSGLRRVQHGVVGG